MSNNLEEIRVDLARFSSEPYPVFADRDRGLRCREEARLAKLEEDPEAAVEVVIPDSTVTLTGSFFQGMFGASVRNLGETGFRAKYRFKCGSHILRRIDYGIQRALAPEESLLIQP